MSLMINRVGSVRAEIEGQSFNVGVVNHRNGSVSVCVTIKGTAADWVEGEDGEKTMCITVSPRTAITMGNGFLAAAEQAHTTGGGAVS